MKTFGTHWHVVNLKSGHWSACLIFKGWFDFLRESKTKVLIFSQCTNCKSLANMHLCVCVAVCKFVCV